MYKALDNAKWLIAYNFGKSETEGEDLITNLKLQKLLYYAQSASLAFLIKDYLKINLKHGDTDMLYIKYIEHIKNMGLIL